MCGFFFVFPIKKTNWVVLKSLASLLDQAVKIKSLASLLDQAVYNIYFMNLFFNYFIQLFYQFILPI
jgi:uncharacterized membrane protein